MLYKTNYIDFSEWNEYSSSSINGLARLININNYEIAAFTREYMYSSSSSSSYHIKRQIKIYNKYNDKWRILTENWVNSSNLGRILLFTFNQYTKEFQISSRITKIQNYKPEKYNIITFKTIDLNQNIKTELKCNVTKINGNIGGMFCDDKNRVHVIVDDQQYIWNIANSNIQMGMQHLQNIFYDCYHDGSDSAYTRFILVPSKKVILIIGAYDHKKKWCNSFRPFGIWKYCLITNKCIELGFAFEYSITSCALTIDEKYVIIAGEQSHNNNADIFILDLTSNEYKLYKSQIKLPLFGICNYWMNMIIIGGPIDEILINGWIKKLFKTKEFEHLSLPPTYLIRMISQWLDQCMLHVFYSQPEYNRPWTIHSKHYEIRLSQILDSIY